MLEESEVKGLAYLSILIFSIFYCFVTIRSFLNKIIIIKIIIIIIRITNFIYNNNNWSFIYQFVSCFFALLRLFVCLFVSLFSCLFLNLDVCYILLTFVCFSFTTLSSNFFVLLLYCLCVYVVFISCNHGYNEIFQSGFVFPQVQSLLYLLAKLR